MASRKHAQKKATSKRSTKSTKSTTKKSSPKTAAKISIEAYGVEKAMEHSCNDHCCKKHSKSGACGGLYFAGFVGAAIFYIVTATGFWNGVLGVLKALVWPAIVVFKLLAFLG